MRWLAHLIGLAMALTVGAANAKSICNQGLCYKSAGAPTGYDHAILGNLPEWRDITYQGRSFRFQRGFIEDTAPRMADVNGDRIPEAIVVHSVPNLGARLVVLGLPHLNEMAATPHIGTHHRWLAVAGIGDFDGDGLVEIAYVDRPHLARQLAFVRLEDGALNEVDRQNGLTNHRIGDETIQSAARACAGDVLLMSGDWQRIMAAKIGQKPLDLGRFSAPAWRLALTCNQP
jgi:hypothetical protein